MQTVCFWNSLSWWKLLAATCRLKLLSFFNPALDGGDYHLAWTLRENISSTHWTEGSILYVGKEVLKSIDCLTVFIHVIFHKLWSMPGYLGVMLQSYEYVSFIMYTWERYLILIQFCSTSQRVVPKYWQCSLSHFFLPTFLNIFTSYSFFK